MKFSHALWIVPLATVAVFAQEAQRTTARDTRVPAVANATAYSVW